MKMTVRQKIFAYMGLLVLIITLSHIFTYQIYMDFVFDGFRKGQFGAAFLNVSLNDQIEMLKAYVIDKMKLMGVGIAIFFIATGLYFSHWISGVITLPLRKLMTAIEQVGKGDLNVNVPMESRDEYGKVVQTFNDMTLRLREAENVRKRMVADVAHELRTPLSIMQLKLENTQQASQHISPEILLRLHDEVIRLSLLVDDLHVLSLAEAGRLTLNCKPIDLRENLQQIVNDVKMEAEENGLNICFTSNAKPVIVKVDARRITQVFINLLTNAIRYTPKGGMIAIDIKTKVVDQHKVYTCISVSDTGMGIPKEELPHLFDRFYRVEKARSRHTGGTGIGLSIAHQFVKAHGGFINVESQLDEGTTFAVYLPSGDCQE
ncbi:two-component system, OmpR family, sensor histidine kinase BaeS [Seinonella peptonophila]|uniref:histidine kinase n=1 Tax=Seinonella peptonophila TaxID=112248 RepID=A0A1M4X644_9BACL|nr:HAMP domain-containing sensor histidine kinase [Seinonella peptonophila]SHE88906.1 two-component system, OmpR family, sensor histidine kinase BaeS [Seinonella peptonophila]